MAANDEKITSMMFDDRSLTLGFYCGAGVKMTATPPPGAIWALR